MKSTLGIIFADNYRGSLTELTGSRTMAAVPYGGRYRQIDFALSNLTNAGIRHIGILTSRNYQSLMNHIGSGQEWDLELEENGLEYLAPYASRSQNYGGSFHGKLDALRAALHFLDIAEEEYVVLVDGGVVCTVDLKDVVQKHVESGADITVVTKSGLTDGKIRVDLGVHPDAEGKIDDIAANFVAGPEYDAAVGIYVMKRELLVESVADYTSHGGVHLERDFILRAHLEKNLTINAYPFNGVVICNETTEEYVENSLALLKPEIRNGLFHQPNLTIYTKVRDQVPVYYGENSEIDDCVVADGCVLEGKAENCVLFRGVKIAEGAEVRNCVIMADTVIGAGAKLENMILDKEVTVPAGREVCGTKEHPIVYHRGETV